MLRNVVLAAAARQGPRGYMEDTHTLVLDFAPNGNNGTASAAVSSGLGPAEVHVSYISGPAGALAGASATAGSGSVASAPPAAAPVAAAPHPPKCSYAAVFDGHSGATASKTAARVMHAHLAAQPGMEDAVDKTGFPVPEQQGPPPSKARQEEAIADALRSAFERTDYDILGGVQPSLTSKGPGSTACVALRVGAQLYVAHAGDSRAVLCSVGKAEQLTQDHKPTVPREARRIAASGGIIDFTADRVVSARSRLNMSRALGDPSHKTPGPRGRPAVEARPDVGLVDLRPGQDEFVVLASDGLWDYVSNQEAVAIVRAALASHGGGGGGGSSGTAAISGGGTAAAAVAGGGGAAFAGGGGTPTAAVGAVSGGIVGGTAAAVPGGGGGLQAAADHAAAALVDAALAAQTHDNVTAVLMMFDWA